MAIEPLSGTAGQNPGRLKIVFTDTDSSTELVSHVGHSSVCSWLNADIQGVNQMDCFKQVAVCLPRHADRWSSPRPNSFLACPLPDTSNLHLFATVSSQSGTFGTAARGASLDFLP